MVMTFGCHEPMGRRKRDVPLVQQSSVARATRAARPFTDTANCSGYVLMFARLWVLGDHRVVCSIALPTAF
jgi:hypothetical protein